jgi:hypothetical protein
MIEQENTNSQMTEDTQNLKKAATSDKKPQKCEIQLQEAGPLSLLVEDEFENVEELRVRGVISGSDVEFFGSVARTYSTMRVLDISQTEGLKEIPRRAFIDCDHLSTIVLPEGIIKFGESSFENCEALVSINFPSSLLSIGVKAFAHCSRLSAIQLPDNLEYIGAKAFRDCDSISSIFVPAKVSDIGAFAFTYAMHLRIFEVDKSNEKYRSEDGVLFSGTVLLQYPQGSEEHKYKIPNGVTKISERAFVHCSLLETVKMPESVMEIGNEAFYFCSNLQSIELPTNVSRIGVDAFLKCQSLQRIDIVNFNNYFDSVDGVVYDENCKRLIIYPDGKEDDEFNIPDTVGSIAPNAFGGNEFLKKITIPASVSSLDNYFFDQFKNLEEIYSYKALTIVPFGFTLKSEDKGSHLTIYKRSSTSIWQKIKKVFE